MNQLKAQYDTELPYIKAAIQRIKLGQHTQKDVQYLYEQYQKFNRYMPESMRLSAFNFIMKHSEQIKLPKDRGYVWIVLGVILAVIGAVMFNL